MSQKICDSCGKEIQEDFSLCPYCGKNLDEQEIVIPVSEPPGSGYKTLNIKEKIWIFPAIAGILTIISLFCPAAYATAETPFFKVKISSYIWIWGVLYGPEGFMYVAKDDFYVLSFSVSMLILILACIVIGLSKRFGAKKISVPEIQVTWIIIGISQIILILYWILEFERIFPGIWSIYNFSFGIIGIFIAGGLLISSGIIVGSLGIEIPKKVKEKKVNEWKHKKDIIYCLVMLSIFIMLLIVILLVAQSK